MAEFRFLHPGPLSDGELTLHLARTTPRDDALRHVATYHFEMRIHGRAAGGIRLRAENDFDVETYAGNIGYNVHPEFRGRRLAERACRLLVPLARAHGFRSLWITCDPSNIASHKTCARLGAELVDMQPHPAGPKCRYRFSLEPANLLQLSPDKP